jgi:hypothetical protein
MRRADCGNAFSASSELPRNDTGFMLKIIQKLVLSKQVPTTAINKPHKSPLKQVAGMVKISGYQPE